MIGYNEKIRGAFIGNPDSGSNESDQNNSTEKVVFPPENQFGVIPQAMLNVLAPTE